MSVTRIVRACAVCGRAVDTDVRFDHVTVDGVLRVVPVHPEHPTTRPPREEAA